MAGWGEGCAGGGWGGGRQAGRGWEGGAGGLTETTSVTDPD